jgi:hypothetical protein
MHWLLGILRVVAFSFLLWIPAWIRVIATTSWSAATKKTAMAAMVMISSTVTAIVLLREHPDRATEAIGNAVWILYLLLVLASAKYYWPRQ